MIYDPRPLPLDVFQRLCKAKQVPVPVREFRFAAPRRWRFDYAWPKEWVALEVEGGAFSRGRHTRGIGFVNDLEKYSEAAVRGWCVVRVTPQQLTSALTLDWVWRGIRR